MKKTGLLGMTKTCQLNLLACENHVFLVYVDKLRRQEIRVYDYKTG